MSYHFLTLSFSPGAKLHISHNHHLDTGRVAFIACVALRADGKVDFFQAGLVESFRSLAVIAVLEGMRSRVGAKSRDLDECASQPGKRGMCE